MRWSSFGPHTPSGTASIGGSPRRLRQKSQVLRRTMTRKRPSLQCRPLRSALTKSSRACPMMSSTSSLRYRHCRRIERRAYAMTASEGTPLDVDTRAGLTSGVTGVGVTRLRGNELYPMQCRTFNRFKQLEKVLWSIPLRGECLPRAVQRLFRCAGPKVRQTAGRTRGA
jgi:hypothetical protein